MKTTVIKLVFRRSSQPFDFEVAEQAVTLELGNAGTAKLIILSMIKTSMFNENVNAFEIADEVTKRTRIVLDLKRMELPRD